MAGLKNILIGVFVLIAFAIIIFILLFLHPSVGDNGKTLIVRLTDVDKINIGTRVTYAGLAVGEVVKIEEIPDARTKRLNYNGDVYVYQLTLHVDSSVNVYNTDVIGVHTSGLLGERNIEINPEPLQPGETLIPIGDDIIYGQPTPSLEDTLKHFSAVSEKLATLLDSLQGVVTQVKDEKIVDKVAHSMQNIVDITDALNQPEKWHETVNNVAELSKRALHSWNAVDASLENVYGLTNRAHQTWATVDQAVHQADAAMQGFRATANNAQNFTSRIDQIVAYTRKGEGSIGRLFMRDDLYLQLKSVLHKGDTVVNDISHYGILFQSNKQWQRLNARRLNLVGRLSTPGQFNAYFNKEIDRLSTSLSQVSITLDESPNYPGGLLYNPEFTTRFSDVIRQVEDVENALKMYNEQLVDQASPTLQ
jgi:phospholipid/cholesterol/gamma-HCH transport system substrate-binding protein